MFFPFFLALSGLYQYYFSVFLFSLTFPVSPIFFPKHYVTDTRLSRIPVTPTGRKGRLYPSLGIVTHCVCTAQCVQMKERDRLNSSVASSTSMCDTATQAGITLGDLSLSLLEASALYLDQPLLTSRLSFRLQNSPLYPH